MTFKEALKRCIGLQTKANQKHFSQITIVKSIHTHYQPENVDLQHYPTFPTLDTNQAPKNPQTFIANLVLTNALV